MKYLYICMLIPVVALLLYAILETVSRCRDIEKADKIIEENNRLIEEKQKAIKRLGGEG